MGRRVGTTALHGVLLLDKPTGVSSNAALQRVRHRLGRPKAGHTGTLDPLATGLLPLCIGEATKFSHALLNAQKTYEASIRFGFRSSTGDAEGELERIATPDFDHEKLLGAIASLTGEIDQTPPMFSALKVDGRPLYALARKGLEVERQPRRVHIARMELLEFSAETARLAITCSKGTYIRVLAEDLGMRLGCGGYLLELRRTAVGPFDVTDALPLSDLDSEPAGVIAGKLLPVDTLLYDLPRLELMQAASERLANGLTVDPGECEGGVGGLVRLYDPDGTFLGIGEMQAPRKLVPRRLMATKAVETTITL